MKISSQRIKVRARVRVFVDSFRVDNMYSTLLLRDKKRVV